MTQPNWRPACAGICVSMLAVACACVLAWAGHVSPAAADGLRASIPTVLQIDPIAPVQAGQPFTVTGIFYRHVEGGNAGIPHRGIKLYVEPLSAPASQASMASLLATVFSDSAGRLRWVVRTPLASGQYRLYFLYTGSPTMRDSVATTELQVLSGPALPDKSSKPVLPAKRERSPVDLSVVAPQQPLMPGSVLTVAARLIDANGTPLPNFKLYLHVSGATQQRATDSRGWATFVIRKALETGQHKADIIFSGTDQYLAAQKQAAITVSAPASTQLAFTPVYSAPAIVGEALKFNAQLTSEGRPLPGGFVRFFVDGEFLRGATTNAQGLAELQLPRNLIAGSHVISATYRATISQADAAAGLSVLLLPRVLEVRAIPPLQGVQIRVGDTILETDARGIAQMPITKTSALTATILPFQSSDANVRAEFDRWSDGVLTPTRKLRLAAEVTTTYQIGFNVSYPVILHFVEEGSGREVEASRLSSILLVSSAGEAISVSATSDGLQWLKANRIIRLEQTLVASPISYQLRKITVDGVNVVNEGQQRFRVEPNAHWTMKLQLHDLEVEVRDALLGTPMGKGLRVDYPSGDSRHVTLDPAGRMRLESLSRGSYTVTVQGAQGLRSPMPVALSRNREVNIAVISYLDLAIGGGILAVIALAALLVGRRKTLPRLIHALR